ncbi:transcriptional coactivator/pterin dehydratase [Pseudovirgaria hyperparasitica]|uniref:4a-hydroxytetrahydrobiopterin dehydratase n=1 Tax=Pseudovirgaria hyperparasitica TaxID=470096 RepID=A0A6A6VPM6_9PEZI|nr:transcriptional coactivator/pterin dehydratase [Pseudovirgaria hyperparasitica]KAF2752572.1 transcriptional coactivator/pterin dehydratase [Pseudovirgaria hyperparasitica]
MQPKIATGEDENKVKSELEELVSSGWQLDKNEVQVAKTYHLASYRNVKFLSLEIMSRSQLKNHHPVLTTTVSSVTVHWTTHNPPGLTEKDTLMAKYCDNVAEIIGTVDPEESKKCGSAQSQI